MSLVKERPSANPQMGLIFWTFYQRSKESRRVKRRGERNKQLIKNSSLVVEINN